LLAHALRQEERGRLLDEIGLNHALVEVVLRRHLLPGLLREDGQEVHKLGTVRTVDVIHSLITGGLEGNEHLLLGLWLLLGRSQRFRRKADDVR